MSSPLGPVRVAHVGHYKPMSADGVCQVMVRLVQDLRSCGLDVQVWDFGTEHADVFTRDVDGVQIVHLPIAGRRWMRGVHEPARVRAQLNELAKGVDLLHIHSVFTPHNVWASRVSVPYVLSPQGGYSPRVIEGRNRVLKKLWIALFERRLWSRAAVLHATNQQEARDLSALPGVARIVTIDNGVDVPSQCPARSKVGGLLYVGRLAVEQKGIDALLEGYAIAKARVGTRLPPLDLVGPSVHDADEVIRQIISERRLESFVQLSPPTFGDAKARLITAAQVFVHTSRWEGMPVSVLEAMALGTPVLITEDTNLGEAVRQYDAGWVCRGTPTDIAAALVELSTCPPDALVEKGANAYRCAAERFSRLRIAKKMIELYRDVLKASEKGRIKSR